MNTTLTVKDGTLYFNDHMLLRVYDAGDCDRCVWPLTEERHVRRLAIALYDAYEMYVPIGTPRAVILPDGSTFYFDEHLDDVEADPGDMDGDAASALASVGWGTDEDYGTFED